MSEQYCDSNLDSSPLLTEPQRETKLTEHNSEVEISREREYFSVVIIYSRGILYPSQTCPNDFSGQALVIDI